MDLKKLKSGTDIRGTAVEVEGGAPVELTDETVTLIVRAFASWLMRKGCPDQTVVAVGHDCRISGERIHNAAIAALNKSGMTVYDCGLCTTPAMFMTTVLMGCEAAISITASHHPFDRNGLKFFTRDGGLESSDIDEILSIAETGSFYSVAVFGKIKPYNFLDTYAAYLRILITDALGVDRRARPLEGLHFAVDAGNGVGGFYATDVLQPLGADISGSVNLDPDGMFPNHIPNPENAQAMECACKATLDSGADLGIIFDTDVDRAGAVGDDGTEINRNRLVALAAAIALEDCPGGTVVTDSVTSSGLKEFINEKLGGIHYRYRRGYKNVIDEAMRLTGEGQICPLAIETSGHAAFRSNYFLDDGAYLITRIIIKMAQLKSEGKNITDLISDLREPVDKCEIRINITVDDFKAKGTEVINALEKFSAEKPGWHIADDNREGIRVNCDDGNGWFLLRLSVHDPVIPLNIESDSAGGCKIIANNLLEFFSRTDGLDLSPLKTYALQ